MDADEQLTTEGKLLCGAVVVAGLFESGRVRVADPADAEATTALQEVLAAMHQFRAELASWPGASH